MMTIDDMIAVLQAAKAGKQIQIKVGSSHDWHDCSFVPCFSEPLERYRVKPEPREWCVWIDPGGVISQFGNHSGRGTATRIKVREVLP